MLGSGGSWIGSFISNFFAFFQPDHGTTVAASGITTASLTSSDSSITITGNNSTKTLDFKASGGSSAIVEISSWSSPTSLANAATITAPVNQREKRYVVSTGGLVSVGISNGSGTQELWIVNTDSTNAVEITGSNILQSGSTSHVSGGLICYHWTQGLNKWVEAHRNEL